MKVLKFLILIASISFAQTSEDIAIKMYSRLTESIPATNSSIIQTMKGHIQNGDFLSAAKEATQSNDFYNIGLKNFAKSFTDVNNEGSIRMPLNDMSATIIGFTRDDIDFSTILSADTFYRLNTTPAFSIANNTHYESAENSYANLKTSLVADTISSVNNFAPSKAAGLLTTRAFAANSYEAGTNRAAVNNIMNQFFCKTMEQVQDSTRPATRVARDVFIVPNPTIPHLFQTRCSGCHGLMDGMRGAFAHYHFNERTMVYDDSKVHDKYSINATNNPTGYITTDDSWINLLNYGVTESFKSTLLSGKGAKSLGTAITTSKQFSVCMSQRVYKKLCLKDPSTTSEKNYILNLANEFKNNSYNMKKLFESAASSARCITDSEGGAL